MLGAELMAAPGGLGNLRDAKDLYAKLQHDNARLKSSPADEYAAFDFFVTAYHLLEWLYPGDAGGTQRKAHLDSDVNLQICRDIANHSKHWQANTVKTFKDVVATEGGFQRNAFQANAFQVDSLVVELNEESATRFGKSIEVIELANKIMAVFAANPNLQ